MCSNVCGQLIVVWYLLHTRWNKKSHDDHVRVVTVQYYTQATVLWCKPRYEFSHLIFMCSHMWQSPLVQWIGWCGLMVNTRTVDIHYDYSRYTKRSKSWNFTKGLHSANGFLFIIDIRDNMTIVRHSKPFHNLLRITREWVITSLTPRFLVALFPVLHYSCHQLAVQVVVRKPGSISHMLIAHIMCKALQACKQVAVLEDWEWS